MLLRELISKELAETFHLAFDVDELNQSGVQVLQIRLHNSDDKYFSIQVNLKAKTRMIVTCEPQQYAAEFVHIIGKSTAQQRQIFVQYLNELQKHGKLILKINEQQISNEDFLESDITWDKFFLRFTVAPYFDRDFEDEYAVVSNYIKIICAMMLALLTYEIEGYNEGKAEGASHIVKSKKYERNPINRELCLLEKGYTCYICGFNFEKVYGEIGKYFIHVHHTTPVHLMGENYVVNPSEELFPVCPNCHAMLHRKDPPYTIEQIKSLLP